MKKLIAGWSRKVARQPHKLKVGGSNPSPATLQTLSSEGRARGAPLIGNEVVGSNPTGFA